MDHLDITTRLGPSYAREVDVHRRERSWTLMAGSRRLSFTRTEYQVSPYPYRVIDQVVHSSAHERSSLTGTVAMVLGVIAGVAMLGLAFHTTRAASIAPYRLSVAIPPKMREPVRTIAVRPHMVVRGSGVVGITRPETTTAVSATSVPPAIDPTMPMDAEPAQMTGRHPAMDVALRTGTLQQWTSVDGAEQGFVVAGPADHGCRTLSILTRRDGGNAVETRRACMDADGGEGATSMKGETAP